MEGLLLHFEKSFMMKGTFLSLALGLGFATLTLPSAARAEMVLGEPPRAPLDVSGLPGGGPTKQGVTGGFTVNTDSREQVRAFYNAVYPSSTGVPIDTTANVATCTPGTNSTAFQEAVLRRINWFRAMAGVPASVTLSSVDSAKNQQAAVMMSANNALSHFPPSTWSCFTADGANAASNSNIALGSDGADSITGYIWDFGANNSEVGHRRWLLYPQTQVMGTGDVPDSGTYNAANTTWVFDANLFGPRPTTRQPYVAWPPEGYVPYQVIYPQWSFALSNANFSAASVSMTSNGVSVAVALQPYLTGYGENTLVWVPMGLDATSAASVFPFSGTDTVYHVTVSNIKVGVSSLSVSYNVTAFDPAVPGADYIPTTITGPSQVLVSTTNRYFCQAVNNPNLSGYQWRTYQHLPGNLVDNAQNGLANFTFSPTADYPLITNPPVGTGKCFHLEHPDATETVPQLLQFTMTLFPASNSVLSFNSLLGYATSDEVARVQASVDGGANWQDLYAQTGSNGPGESSFTLRTLALSAYAGKPTLLRFNYDFPSTGGSYFIGDDPTIGWCLENIAITNAEQLVNPSIVSTASTNFTLVPAQAGVFSLEAQALIFTQFPVGWGPAKILTVVPALLVNNPVLLNGQTRLDFNTTPGTTGTFKLLQASRLGGAWTTNTSAVLTTNVPGSSYRFTVPSTSAVGFYRVLLVPGQ